MLTGENALRGTDLETTDRANALRLVEAASGSVLYVPSLGWHAWTGTHWAEDEGPVVRLACQISGRVMQEAAWLFQQASGHKMRGHEEKSVVVATRAGELFAWGQKSAGASRIAAMQSLGRHFLAVPASQLDGNPWVLNVANGTLDLYSGELRRHDPKDLITRLAPVVYDPQAQAPWWDAFLQKVLPDDLRQYLQRAAGYALTGCVGEQCLFFLLGRGANGKTTFLNALRSMLGPYAVKAPADLLMATDNGERHPTDIMTLRGARLVICSEIEEGRRWASQRFKELTGEEDVTARRMHRDFETFRLTAKLFVMANSKPRVSDRTDAFWRRMRLVPFGVQVPDEEQDRGLDAKLQGEASGILNWALAGLRACLVDGGLGIPPAVRDAVAQYRQDTDHLATFVAEVCVYGSRGLYVQPSELYEAYRAWCEPKPHDVLSMGDFKAALYSMGYERKKVQGVDQWKGIALKSPKVGGWGPTFPYSLQDSPI